MSATATIIEITLTSPLKYAKITHGEPVQWYCAAAVAAATRGNDDATPRGHRTVDGHEGLAAKHDGDDPPRQPEYTEGRDVGKHIADTLAGIAGARRGYLPKLTSALVTGTALSGVVLGAVALREQ